MTSWLGLGLATARRPRSPEVLRMHRPAPTWRPRRPSAAMPPSDAIAWKLVLFAKLVLFVPQRRPPWLRLNAPLPTATIYGTSYKFPNDFFFMITFLQT